MPKIKIDALSDTIMEALNDFEDATEEVVDNAIKTASNNALHKLRNAHPSGSGKYSSWDDYNKGWKITKTTKKRFKTATLHNATKYQLTHLLEKGHAKVSGGRTKAFPHIAEVAEQAESEFLDEVKRGIN